MQERRGPLNLQQAHQQFVEAIEEVERVVRISDLTTLDGRLALLKANGAKEARLRKILGWSCPDFGTLRQKIKVIHDLMRAYPEFKLGRDDQWFLMRSILQMGKGTPID